MTRTSLLSALVLALGCAAESEAPGELTKLRCAGTLPDSPVLFIYRADVLAGEPQTSEVRVVLVGEAVESWSDSAEVVAELDWRGESNGGTFLFRQLGAMLNVEYRDPDGDVFWSMPGCFD